MAPPCAICTTPCAHAASLYTCPRCGIPYCSVTCFQSQKHATCSESFYRKQCQEALVGESLPPPLSYTSSSSSSSSSSIRDHHAQEHAHPSSLTLEEWSLFQSLLATRHHHRIPSTRTATSLDDGDSTKSSTIDHHLPAIPSHVMGLLWKPWWEEISGRIVDPDHPSLPPLLRIYPLPSIHSCSSSSSSSSSHASLEHALEQSSLNAPTTHEPRKSPSPLLPMSIFYCLLSYLDACRYFNGLYDDPPQTESPLSTDDVSTSSAEFMLEVSQGSDLTFSTRPALVSALLQRWPSREELSLVLHDAARIFKHERTVLLCLHHLYAVASRVQTLSGPLGTNAPTTNLPSPTTRMAKKAFLFGKKMLFYVSFIKGHADRLDQLERLHHHITQDISFLWASNAPE